MPDAELETDAAPRDPTQMLDAFLVAAVRPPLRRLGPPAGRVVGLFVGLVAATTSLAYVGAHAADARAATVEVELLPTPQRSSSLARLSLTSVKKALPLRTTSR